MVNIIKKIVTKNPAPPKKCEVEAVRLKLEMSEAVSVVFSRLAVIQRDLS